MAKYKKPGPGTNILLGFLFLGVVGLALFSSIANRNLTMTTDTKAQTVTTLYNADFTKLWGVRTGSGGTTVLNNNVYSTTGVSRGYLNLEINGVQTGQSAGAGVHLPYTLPTTGFYMIDFDAKLTAGSNYDSWIRLMTNLKENASLSPSNTYIVSVQPSTRTYEILKLTNGVYSTLAAGTVSTAIKANDQVNHFKVYRDNTTGIIKLTINGVLVKQVIDTSFKGGYNRLSISSYVPSSKAQIYNFKVTK